MAEITNTSNSLLAFSVPGSSYTMRRMVYLAPSEGEELDASQAESVKGLVDDNLVKMSDGRYLEKRVENVTIGNLSFPVPGRTVSSDIQVVIAPGESVVLTDEQAACQSVVKLLSEGKVSRK